MPVSYIVSHARAHTLDVPARTAVLAGAVTARLGNLRTGVEYEATAVGVCADGTRTPPSAPVTFTPAAPPVACKLDLASAYFLGICGPMTFIASPIVVCPPGAPAPYFEAPGGSLVSPSDATVLAGIVCSTIQDDFTASASVIQSQVLLPYALFGNAMVATGLSNNATYWCYAKLVVEVAPLLNLTSFHGVTQFETCKHEFCTGEY